MNGEMIRVLFGVPSPSLVAEIQNALRSQWAREEVVHFALGGDNANLLRSLGCWRVMEVHRQPFFRKELGFWYSKTYLLGQAVDQLREVLYLDFDSRCMRRPDEEMWNILRSKRGRVNGDFQANVARYTTAGIHCPKVRPMLNSGVVYCRDSGWVDRWLEETERLARLGGRRAPQRYSEEYPLIEMVDRHVGKMSVAELVEAFEPAISTGPRGVRGRGGKTVYFQHGDPREDLPEFPTDSFREEIDGLRRDVDYLKRRFDMMLRRKKFEKTRRER